MQSAASSWSSRTSTRSTQLRALYWLLKTAQIGRSMFGCFSTERPWIESDTLRLRASTCTSYCLSIIKPVKYECDRLSCPASASQHLQP
jgi:hypothetical protein